MRFGIRNPKFGIKRLGSHGQCFAGRGFFRAIALLLLALVCGLSSSLAQTKATIADTIQGPDGSVAVGSFIVSSPSTFTSADNHVVMSGQIAGPFVLSPSGSFSVALIPNAGSTPK